MIRECLGATKVFAAICLLVPANASRADPAAERARRQFLNPFAFINAPEGVHVPLPG